MRSSRATLRKCRIRQGGKACQYWVVDYSYSENGQTRRKQRHSKRNADAELFKAEIERQLARARYSGLALRREHFAACAGHGAEKGQKAKSLANTLQIVKRAAVWGIDGGLPDQRPGRASAIVRLLFSCPL